MQKSSINLFKLPSSQETEKNSLEGALEEPILTASLRFELLRVIEALLFATSEPIPLDRLRQILETIAPIKPKELRSLISELQYDYQVQRRAFRLEEIAEGFLLRSAPEFAPYIELMVKQRRSERLSPAATEVVAIIAYRQPITRPQVEAIRGVDSSGTIQNLLERGFIAATGRLEAPGRPTLYCVTPLFLQHFGLRSIQELPSLPITT